MANQYSEKVYKNSGNHDVLRLIDASVKDVLDVGCGAGDNARILKESGKRVTGLTISEKEAEVAKNFCNEVIIADVEDPAFQPTGSYDVILMSHICEHLRNPEEVIEKFARALKEGGRVIIAVPNMAYYKLRFRMLSGNWELEETGPFDRTHLHFYSYDSADQLYARSNLVLKEKIGGTLAAPLWPLRKLVPGVARKIDSFLGNKMPNLFSIQVILVYQKQNSNKN
jgi:SAM-dependent methyltransferase